jgi:hypothetical protein
MTVEEVLAKHGLTPLIPDSCGDGWTDIVDRLCSDLAAMGWDGTLSQVKSKFGGLRFYADLNGVEDTKSGWARIDEAEAESYRTCEVCGEPGALVCVYGWYSTVCEEHHQEQLRQAR